MPNWSLAAVDRLRSCNLPTLILGHLSQRVTNARTYNTPTSLYVKLPKQGKVRCGYLTYTTVHRIRRQSTLLPSSDKDRVPR